MIAWVIKSEKKYVKEFDDYGYGLCGLSDATLYRLESDAKAVAEDVDIMFMSTYKLIRVEIKEIK